MGHQALVQSYQGDFTILYAEFFFQTWKDIESFISKWTIDVKDTKIMT